MPAAISRVSRALFLVLTMLAACSTDTGGGSDVTVSISPTGLDLTVGTTLPLDAQASSGGILWRSRSTPVATIAPDGTVTGIAPGTATIVALAAEDSTAGDSVTVTVHAEVYIAVSPGVSELATGSTRQFEVSVFGSNTPDVSWSSSLPGVASVTPDGVVTASTPGTATITATLLSDPSRHGSATVTVTVPPAITPASSHRLGQGWVHGCGLTTDGRAFCWGYGDHGQLGNGQFGSSTTRPTPVVGGQTWSTISADGYSTCGVTTSGEGYCWGYNSEGQLGTGDNTDQDRPTAVSGGLTFALIDVAPWHACGLTTGGAVYCWGSNVAGNLGDGTNSGTSSVPVPVAIPGGAIAISAGERGSCALSSAHDAYCWGPAQAVWGSDQYDRTGYITPTLVPGGHKFVTVSIGADHAVGLTATGEAWSWGGRGGAQGVGSNLSDTLPRQVVGGTLYKAAVAGNGLVVALAEDGTLQSWGDGNYGALGDGSGTGWAYSPVVVSGGGTFKAIGTGGWSTVVLTTGGEALAFGRNDIGQLGLGGSNDALAPTIPDPPGFDLDLPTYVTVQAGDAISVPIAVIRGYGRFTENGPARFSGAVALAITSNTAGADITLGTTTIAPSQSSTTVDVAVPSSLTPGNYFVGIQATSPGAPDTPGGFTVVVTAPPPPGGGGGGTGTFVCPGALPSGYQCVDLPDGRQAPVKFALPNGPTGPWTNGGLDLCIDYKATGVSDQTFGAGIGGGPTSASGKWGALVNTHGELVLGGGTVMYIFTGVKDAQVALQNWDTATGGWVQGGWSAGGGC